MADRIQIRRDTAENWTSANPILAQGEFGVETDTLKLKIGDGVTYWRDLRYYHSGSPYIPGTGIDITDFRISNTGIVTLTTGSANGTVKANNTDVAVKGLGSAAYTSSTDYATSEQGSKADNAADKNLSNLTAQGANIGNWSSNISNCITEIPQDINLTLSNGTLTLKAGSKVYVPNGAGVFDEITVASDKTITAGGTTTLFVYYRGGGLNIAYLSASGSGSTTPTATTSYGMFYNTTDNKVYFDNGSWLDNCSLPIAIVSTTSGQITSIDQLFNGFGYIGSTVFALPGVKGLVPNGRNADGTLKNIAFTVSSVLTTTDTSSATGGLEYYLSSVSINRANFGAYSYDAESNNIVNSSGARQNIILIDPSAYRTSGKVTSFNPKTVFHAVDYSDSDYITNCAMPSGKYIDLTLPAVNTYTTFTSPADGYYSLSKLTTGIQYAQMSNTSASVAMSYVSANSGDSCRIFVPVSKGDIVGLMHNLAGTTSYFRFVYANGVK